MIRFRSLLVLAMVVGLLGAGVVLGHWDEGDSAKWIQLPDRTTNGVDVEMDNRDDIMRVLGDDFLCTETGAITDIHLWCSYYRDLDVSIDWIELSIWSDVPDDPQEPDDYSHPGMMLWSKLFMASEIQTRLYADLEPQYEWFWDPYTGFQMPNGDQKIWQLNFHIEDPQFIQEGTEQEPIVYWLVARAYLIPSALDQRLGWKTRQWPEHYNDDAVRGDILNWPTVNWYELRYPFGHEYETQSMDLAFVIQGEGPDEEFDWGDAPDRPYPTVSANNGANHYIVPGLLMGALIDPEPDGQPDPAALGDDNDTIYPQPAPNDDEDGVTFSTMSPGLPATMTIDMTAATMPGFIDAWIDFDGSGVWGDNIGEQIAASAPVNPGLMNLINFNVPPYTTIGQQTFARVRLSSYGGLPPTGSAQDGEVEDYEVLIEEEVEDPCADLGDAPDSTNTSGNQMTTYGGAANANFPTVFAAGSPPYGPLHRNPLSVAYLGTAVSLENEADIYPPDQDLMPNIDPPANAADQDGVDDSVNPLGADIHQMQNCHPSEFDYTVTIVNPAIPMYVNVFFDWNLDGDWDDSFVCPQGIADEHAVKNQMIQFASPGTYTVTTPRFLPYSPAGIGVSHYLWMRITLSEQPYSPSGGAGTIGGGGSGPSTGYQYGETEDFLAYFWGDADHDAELGDAPDSTNNSGVPMTAYISGVPANFPTVYTDFANPGGPFGPIHIYRGPIANHGAELGITLSEEQEADNGPDNDTVNNIDPPNNVADLDGADDALSSSTITLPDCDMMTLNYNVNIIIPQPYYVNMWFDWNRDGDWDDTFDCCGVPAPEHAVVDQLLNLTAGPHTVTTPSFIPWHLPGIPADPCDDIWMRITLAEQPYSPSGAGGSGPAMGYMLGETEDHLLSQTPTCWDSFACGGQQSGDAECDGDVDLDDFLLLANSWRKSAGAAAYNCCADFDHDSTVDIVDLAVMASSWLDTGLSPATNNSTCP
ncbi:MAG: hypothetical protein JW936_00995 [Sedimentisphaerales bacterium]|nr:hypothetical protein [Sedimentisphaerales bacterium]